MQLVTIIEAATFSGKSIQTIRRMIKQKKIRVKRQKTPQGFNYLIVKESLTDFLNKYAQTSTHDLPLTQEIDREHRPIDSNLRNEFQQELDRLTMTIQKLIEQNDKDKENFFQLIKTFQDRIFVLENQIKLLEAPQSSWWQFWK